MLINTSSSIKATKLNSSFIISITGLKHLINQRQDDETF